MKTFWWVVAILWAGLALAVVSQAQQPKLTHLMVDSLLIQRLEEIAETDSLEDARCLAGRYTADDTIKLEAAYDTPWLLSNRSDSSALFEWQGCPPGSMAWWHSHPWRTIRKWSKQYNVSPAVYCELSQTDQIGRRFPFALVSIHKGLTCFFWQKPDGTYARIPFERDSQ